VWSVGRGRLDPTTVSIGKNQMSDSSESPRVQLAEAHRDELEAILRAAGVDFARNRPVVFGSRADGTARRYSDIDLGFANDPL
jgi:hypothetical protein